MALIGTFQPEEEGYRGRIRTLTIDVEVVLQPTGKQPDNEKLPDFRVKANGFEIGAAWNREQKEPDAKHAFGVKLDDPILPGFPRDRHILHHSTVGR